MSPRYSNVTSSIRGHDYTICITQSQIHLFNQHKVLPRVLQIFYRKVKTKMCASTPMHRLPQCHRGNPQIECQNIYQVNQYDTPFSPRVFNCKTYIKCSQIHKSIQSDNNEISKGKTQFNTTR